MGHRSSLIIFIPIIFLMACNSTSQLDASKDDPFNTIESFKATEYAEVGSNVKAGIESKINLEDGATILIPANAIGQDLVFHIERNPKISFEFPSFGEDAIQLSDFYNFEVDGELSESGSSQFLGFCELKKSTG